MDVPPICKIKNLQGVLLQSSIEEDEVPHYYCGDCVHYKFKEDGYHLAPCKRVDHDIIQFRTPFFAVYDGCHHSGIICCDFEPRNKTWWRWPSFWDFWAEYVKVWIPYENTDILYYFVLKGQRKIAYGVRLMDFVKGTMIEGNTLAAVEKMYYTRRNNGANGFAYHLIHEPINGVSIKEAARCLNKS